MQRDIGSAPLWLESLEPRVLLSAFSWTDEEVYLTELVNWARANPLAEGARLGIDLTEGLTAAEAARLVPSEPLALNAELTLAARAHSLDMANRDFFDHVNPDGLNPTHRAQNQGYDGTAGENIAAGYSSIDEVHRAWLESVGHRKNVLSLHANFTSSFHYDEFGPGFAFTTIAPFYDYYSQEFGVQAGTPEKFLLGVVYDDMDADQFYSIGEGVANIRIDVRRANDASVLVGTYTTDAAGNYQIAVPAGNYTVTYTNLLTDLVTTRSVGVSNVNVQANVFLDEIVESPGGPSAADDHANAGAWAQATVVFIDPTSGDGLNAGLVTPANDTDLFRFTVAASGTLSVTVAPSASSGLVPALHLFGATQNPLGAGTPTGDGRVIFDFAVAIGQTYFVLVQSDGASTGGYVVSVNGPGLTGGGGGPGDGTVPPSDASLIAGPNAFISGSALPSGRLTLTTANTSGRPIVFQQTGAGGQWTASDLLTRAGGSNAAGDPFTWTDPKDGRTYAGLRSNAGLLLFTNDTDGTWTFRNLSAEIAGAALITGMPTVFVSTDNVVSIAGLTGAGELVLYTQTGAEGPSGYTWTFVNLTTQDLAPQGVATPAFVGPLISYVTEWNGLNIAGLDAQGNIRAVWWAPGLPRWTSTNLSEATGAAPLSGGLTAYLTPWGGINLAGIDGSGNVSVAWWVPGFEGEWRHEDLTTSAGGPNLLPGSVASYVTSWGGLNVVGVDTAGRLVAYWWAPTMVEVFGEDRWKATVLSDAVGTNAPRPSGRVTGVSVGDSISIAGIDNAGSVIRYWWSVGGEWQAEDVTGVAVAV